MTQYKNASLSVWKPPIHVICDYGTACCHAEQHSSRIGRTRPHQTYAAGSQQSAVSSQWLAPATGPHGCLSGSGELYLLPSSDDMLTAGDEANATMQHAREKHMHTNNQPTTLVCTWCMQRTYSSTMYIFRTYQRQEHCVYCSCSFAFESFFL